MAAVMSWVFTPSVEVTSCHGAGCRDVTLGLSVGLDSRQVSRVLAGAPQTPRLPCVRQQPRRWGTVAWHWKVAGLIPGSSLAERGGVPARLLPAPDELAAPTARLTAPSACKRVYE